MQPIVSIILPTYNDLSYLETTLRSITAQTFTNFELLIIDDGSNDETPIRLRAMIAADTRLRYVRREHSGVGATRNTGLDQAHGRYIAFVDADDLLHPAFLLTLVNAAENAKADIVHCLMHDFADGTSCNFPTTYTVAGRNLPGLDAVRALLNREITASVCCRLYRRETQGQLRFSTGIIYEDLDYSVRAMQLASKVHIVPLALYGYRHRQNGLRVVLANHLVEDRVRTLRLIKQSLQHEGHWLVLRSDFQKLALYFVGFEGFKDLTSRIKFDEALYLSLLNAVRTDGELNFKLLRKMDCDKESKKWVGLALLHPNIGRWWLAFQQRRQLKQA